jgi:hypothetical protein
MVRQVPDDFHALLMCNAMEAAGGQPFSACFVPAHKTRHFPYYDIDAAWHVFGRVEDPDRVDDTYEALCAGNASGTGDGT